MVKAVAGAAVETMRIEMRAAMDEPVMEPPVMIEKEEAPIGVGVRIGIGIGRNAAWLEPAATPDLGMRIAGASCAEEQDKEAEY
jgi:hypothetical protein